MEPLYRRDVSSATKAALPHRSGTGPHGDQGKSLCFPGDDALAPFRRFAFFTLARDAGFVGLAAAILMLACSFYPALAFSIGASVILLFCLGLLLRVGWLTEERIVRTEQWYALEPPERPAGHVGQCRARDNFEELLLRFAKSASGVASVLYGFALFASLS